MPLDPLSNPPTLHTDRLTLRASAAADFADSAAMWGDAAVVRHIGGRPFSEEEVWSRLLRYAGLWAMLGFGYWTIREVATGRFVGETGFAAYRRDIVPRLDDAPECGWALAPWAHGQGYATEALRAVLAWADRSLDHERTVCLIDPGNAASLHLAQKVGYSAFAAGRYRGTEVTLFERMRGPTTA